MPVVHNRFSVLESAMPSLLYAALLTCAVVSSTLAEQPQVTTSLGTLVGSVQQTLKGRNFFAFQGVPYAKPPVGKHRFKQSVPIVPWTGVYNATRAPAMCYQEVMPEMIPNIPLEYTGSEDCLYLNIYTPKLPTEEAGGKLLDVIVYIHGGAFKVGAGDIWGPLILLDRDVILVTFNYRLGILGFLSLEDNVVPGNNGLKDQRLALQWVQNHIASFGGDPNKVTIAGMSAGGASVHFHLLSPLSAGLFNKAIPNSGSALNPWAIAKNPKASALALAQLVGCPINDTMLTLRCLRERPAEHLLVAGRIMSGPDGLTLPFLPVVEPQGPNAFIDKHPIDIIEAKGFNDVPALFSYCDDEGSMFALKIFFDEKTLETVESNWDVIIPKGVMIDIEPAKGVEIAQKLRKRFLGDKTLKEKCSRIFTDVRRKTFR
uniref:Carboxylic ester hydrolase n=1 Tax=Lygus hesperus TaxID=30085 RepID=A0A0K8TIJ0_LYGHE